MASRSQRVLVAAMCVGLSGAFSEGMANQPGSAEASCYLENVARETPSWSPDGGAIVVDNGEELGLRIVTVPGGSVSGLTSDPYHKRPEWSPVGGAIAFVASREQRVVVREPGTGGAMETVAEEADLFDRPWSRDGKRLLVRRPGALWVVDAEGGEQRILSVGDQGVTDAVWAGDSTGVLAVLAGRSVVRIGAKEKQVEAVPGLEGFAPLPGTAGSVWAIGVGPSRPLLRWKDGEVRRFEVAPVESFDVSQTGRLAVAVSKKGIAVLDAAGSPEVWLEGAGVGSPRWSPDGQRIAYVRASQAGSTSLCVKEVP